MASVSLDLTRSSISDEDILSFQGKINDIHARLHLPEKDEGFLLGWINAPTIWMEQLPLFNDLAERIRNQSQMVIVIGIGGSYLGAKAAIKALKPNYSNRFAGPDRDIEVFFAGNNLNTDYHTDLMRIAREKDFSLIVISKSGTTLEPAIGFKLFRDIADEKYGDGARERIYVITDEQSGVLKEIADTRGYEKLPFPADVGGRFSVLTPSGILPIAAAGIDINQLLQGAIEMQKLLENSDIVENIAYRYAVVRDLLHRRGKKIEILGNYDPKLFFLGEWWKQLFGETEGKDEKGLFPASANFTTDLHSLGQYIQEGPKIMFESIIKLDNPWHRIELNGMEATDELGFLEGKTLEDVQKAAQIGTIEAHTGEHIPNVLLSIPELSPYNIGGLFYFFETACAASALLLNVNPFNQPGVEKYKKNMFALLGKQ